MEGRPRWFDGRREYESRDESEMPGSAAVETFCGTLASALSAKKMCGGQALGKSSKSSVSIHER